MNQYLEANEWHFEVKAFTVNGGFMGTKYIFHHRDSESQSF